MEQTPSFISSQVRDPLVPALDNTRNDRSDMGTLSFEAMFLSNKEDVPHSPPESGLPLPSNTTSYRNPTADASPLDLQVGPTITIRRQRMLSIDGSNDIFTLGAKPVLEEPELPKLARGSESTSDFRSRLHGILKERNRESSPDSSGQVALSISHRRDSGNLSIAKTPIETPRKIRHKSNGVFHTSGLIQSTQTTSAATKSPLAFGTPSRSKKSIRSGSLSPKLLSDFGPISLTPTQFPSPRVWKGSKDNSVHDSPQEQEPRSHGMGGRLGSRRLVQDDVMKIRELYPISSIKEDENP